MWTDLLPTLLTLLMIAVQLPQAIAADARLPAFTPVPTASPILNSVFIEGFNTDGCPRELHFGADILTTIGCNPITITGITTVIVYAKDAMPSTCILTLYADSQCIGPSKADIGPIFPTSRPSACIGPIRDSTGAVFEAKGAHLQC